VQNEFTHAEAKISKKFFMGLNSIYRTCHLFFSA